MAKCQKSYFSQILKGKSQLSTEQGYRLCSFWGFGQLECDYFLALLEKDRASDKALLKHLDARLASIRKQSRELEAKFKASEDLAQKYYSSWHWSAIHLATDIEGIDTIDSLAKFLELPVTYTRNILNKLSHFGLISFDEHQKLQCENTDLHVGLDSSSYLQHHLNWQRKSNEHLQFNPFEGAHYTSVQVHSKADQESILAILSEAVKRIQTLVSKSKSEELTCLNVDLFPIGK